MSFYQQQKLTSGPFFGSSSTSSSINSQFILPQSISNEASHSNNAIIILDSPTTLSPGVQEKHLPEIQVVREVIFKTNEEHLFPEENNSYSLLQSSVPLNEDAQLTGSLSHDLDQLPFSQNNVLTSTKEQSLNTSGESSSSIAPTSSVNPSSSSASTSLISNLSNAYCASNSSVFSPKSCYNSKYSRTKKMYLIESSFLNLSSVIQERFSNNNHQNDSKNHEVNNSASDKAFINLIASELAHLDEPKKALKKQNLLKVLYE